MTIRMTMPVLALLPALSTGLVAATIIGGVQHGQASTAQLAPERLTIRASAPHLPKTLPAGILELTLVNDTKGGAGADLGRANPGATIAQINAANAATNGNNAGALAGFIRLTHLVTFLGGVDTVPPGVSETAILDLRTPGTYGLNVAVDNGPGVTPIFRVLPGAGQAATLPPADVTIRLKDMKFLGVPKQLAAGQITLGVRNEGPSVHELMLARLDPGKTQQDVLAFLHSPQGQNGPPPSWIHAAGGVDSISPHQTAAVTLTLTQGYYVAMCFMPDVKKQGMPHVMEGMIGHFIVQ